ncbi:MAG TPA: DUF3562 domain-containing protein [Nitrospirota bacterium]|nr:DUF3562 domain-containing protein [Nitrospirota bacterium]
MPEQSVKNAGPIGDEKDHGQHARAIQKLAQELGISVEEVSGLYRDILEVLKKDAKIRIFLPIIVSRIVKERLQHS